MATEAKPAQKRFCVAFPKATADPTRGALVASAEAKLPFRRVLFCQAFFFAPLVSKKKAGKRFGKRLCRKGNPPLVRFPSFRLRRKFTLRWRFGRIKEFRPLRRATADRGGSDELLKKLEQNFQTDNAYLADKLQFIILLPLHLPPCAVPLFSPSAKIHPSVALWKDKGVSHLARCDRRSRRLRRAF